MRLDGLGLASVSEVSPIAWSCSLGQAAQYLNEVLSDFDGQECRLRFELDDALKLVNKLKFKFKFPLNSEQFWPLSLLHWLWSTEACYVPGMGKIETVLAPET